MGKAEETRAQIGEHWNRVTQRAGTSPSRWWQIPQIQAHINRRVGGVSEPGLSRGLQRRLRDRHLARGPTGTPTFPFAVSVGGGAGQKEMDLLAAGLVGRFDLYELSTERIERGRDLAERRGLADRIRFVHEDPFIAQDQPRYDLVHWNNALHHMLDVEDAIRWSHNILLPGGIFYMDDFVGPSRFQWSDRALAIASGVRAHLPDRFMVSPRDPSRRLARQLKRPRIEAMVSADPSEAADSGRIVPTLRRVFPGADIVATGGVVYHLALSDVLANFDLQDEADRERLDFLLALDELCVSISGLETHYAVCLAQRPEHAPPLRRSKLRRRAHGWRRRMNDARGQLVQRARRLQSSLGRLKRRF